MFGLILNVPPEKFHDFLRNTGAEWLGNLEFFVRNHLIKLLGVLLFTWLLITAVNFFTRRMARLAQKRTGAAAGRAAQVRTLASVLRATAISIIGFLAALQILRDVFDFNLAPLLTGAGVLGVAIGLAAQTIVKDVLNGMLILAEDQYNVGDVVRIAGLAGTVEMMSLRKTTVRDGDGTLYVVPNSQITTVANLTRDFSVATINVSVDYSADPDKVLALLKETAMGVRNDPAYKQYFLADPTLLGVDAIKGSQVIYPVQLRTLANQQWVPMRETQRRIRIALAKNGMLPGDPLRVFTEGGGSSAAGMRLAQEARPGADPTAAKAKETNPFTGESS